MSLISGRRSPDSQACLFLPRPEMFQHSSLKMSREPLPPPLRILLFDRSAVRLRYPNHRHMRYRHSLARRPFTFRLISILFGASADTPSASFYRLYEFFVIDWTVQFRNELEYFWTHAQPAWALAALPEPTPDPLEDITDATVRYSIMAGLCCIMEQAYNRLILLGLPRDAPAISSG